MHICFLSNSEKRWLRKTKSNNQTKLVFWFSLPRPEKMKRKKKSNIWGYEHTNWQAGVWVTEGTYKVNALGARKNDMYVNHQQSGKELKCLYIPQ